MLAAALNLEPRTLKPMSYHVPDQQTEAPTFGFFCMNSAGKVAGQVSLVIFEDFPCTSVCLCSRQAMQRIGGGGGITLNPKP